MHIVPKVFIFGQHFKQIIPTPIKRSKRWISSSIPAVNWETSLAKYSSADYHVNNVVSPVLFKEALQCVPDNAVVLEIGVYERIFILI